jgi:hypothetical protein
MIAMEKEHAMTVPVFVIKDGEVQIVLKDMLYMEKSFQMELLYVTKVGQVLLVMKNHA